MFKKIIISIVIFFGVITFAQSETSWIKKKDKNEKVQKVEKEKSSSWIKKKEVKENKKKLKEKIKESKSWISKKSKDKIKNIKKKLKKHKSSNNLPKAELYFAIAIDPSENEKAKFIYGYINSDKKSEKTKKFKFKNNNFYSHNDGIAFFDDNKTTCQIDVLKGIAFNELKGKAIIKCKNKEILAADINFENNGKNGKGYNIVFKGGRSGTLEFNDTIEKNIAKLENYKTTTSRKTLSAQAPKEENDNLNLQITGKYYALLIGNSNYAKWTSLQSPKNDVNAIAEILDKKYNFDVTTIIDGSYKEIFKAFNDLSKVTTDKDYVLIYYAGHGEIIEDRSFWIPIDAEKEFGFGDWINISDIEVYLEKKIPAHHLAVMVDSCYFAVSQKGSQDYSQENLLFQKYLKDRARIVLASGTNQPVDDTNKGNHSLFGYTFIKTLEANKNVINLLKIRDELILAHSNKRQQPFGHGMRHWGHNGGDFVFITKK